ncbi:S49 family peptidase [Niveispirillum sp. SYP-B3756]|uniref:S49 family peptidase n=1 Tax=Niveispirillum sp. SYP-B3756 TaxID=2662178 RepID=UPI001292683E|nr:S49 family peptidase [Niveispirillum sp. SYP-B3756]MQP63895.1 S49 family peptidase [Niveispirillum sp. SYP-B3756]
MLFRRIAKFAGADLPPIVAAIRLSGVIAASSVARRGLSLEALAEPIERAFALPDVSAVALIINSPGGSPVQSALIAGRIRQLSAEKSVPVLAFVEDVAASGGYWLACAADEIVADPASIVGSIGVISAGFGFQQAIARLGVERRVYTSGTSKSMLDPFQPEKPEDVAHLKGLQEEVHDGFRQWVRARRGARLAGQDEASLFSGAFWSGARAKELGLVDRLGDMRSTLRERFGEKVRIQVVNPTRRAGLGRFIGLDSRVLSADLADGLIDAAEQRSIYARFGL